MVLTEKGGQEPGLVSTIASGKVALPGMDRRTGTRFRVAFEKISYHLEEEASPGTMVAALPSRVAYSRLTKPWSTWVARIGHSFTLVVITGAAKRS